MNIRQATEQIEGAVRAYLATDGRGLPLVPEQMQRPIIMMGPPGIGKTAIVSQVAERLGINFVSYSITHHTRQSALGLPYIADATFGGRTYRVSRYTMSEIIGAAYDAIEASGVAQGILFLDEVNCVSETLAPAMLQFLQYKTFGQHRLPLGWAIVCAGNPPEYNRAARDFDPATMDRMKRIDVEPSLEVWMDYAVAHGVHPAITTYLSNKPASFYRVRAAATGTRMVTARGWEDLSRMLVAYEREGLEVGVALVGQYLQDREIAEDFALYWDLFAKYQDDYKVDAILAGKADEAIVSRARRAAFDERVALVNLLLDAVVERVHAIEATEGALRRVRDDLSDARGPLTRDRTTAQGALEALAAQADEERTAARAGGASPARQALLAERATVTACLRDAVRRWALGVGGDPAPDGFEVARAAFNARAAGLKDRVSAAAACVDAALSFVGEAFGDGQELLVLLSHLAVDPEFTRFVSAHGPASFVERSQALLFHERALELLQEVRALQSL